MKNRIVLWLLSAIVLTVANTLWALHDWYFWDGATKEFILTHFKDWHYLKLIMQVMFIASLLLLPRTWYFVVAWIVLRWTTWEVGCYLASMSGPYTGSQWLSGAFYLSLDMAIVLSIIVTFIALPVHVLSERMKKIGK